MTLDIGLIPTLNFESADHVVADQRYCDIVLSRKQRISFPVVGPLSCYVTLSSRSVAVPQHKSADHGFPSIYIQHSEPAPRSTNDPANQAFDLKIGKTIRGLVLEILSHERKILVETFLETENTSMKSSKPEPSRRPSATASPKKVGKPADTHGARLTVQQKVDLVTAPGITQTPERRVKAVKDLGEGSKAAQQAMESLRKQGLVDRSKVKESPQEQSLVGRPKANDIDISKSADTKTSEYEETETSKSESETSESKSESEAPKQEPKARKTRGIAQKRVSRSKDTESSDPKVRASKTGRDAGRSTRLVDKPVKTSKALLDVYDLGESEDEAWDMPVYQKAPRHHRN